MQSRKPPISGYEPLDFLFKLQDSEGVDSLTLAREFNVTAPLISVARRGGYKRIMNPVVTKLAKRFGYKFALVPIDRPDIELRPEHAGSVGVSSPE